MKFFAVFFLAASACLAGSFSTGQAARLVIGQSFFTEQFQGAGESLLGGVGGVAFARDMLFVTDANRIAADPINHRVLVYRDLSTMLPAPTAELEYTRRCPVCGGTASVVLGQPDFEETAPSIPPTQSTVRTPTGVASDGVILAVADTDNNRVLIWNSIPLSHNTPADVVLGQADFTSVTVAQPPNASSLRGPQGVWVQNGKLFVADTFNNRVLIWNSIPTTNGKAADVVLGQAGFNVGVQMDLTQVNLDPQAQNLVSPVAVTTDGQRLYVADLGHNRVLIWNSIPTQNQQPADVVVGQPDMTSAVANNSPKLCQATRSGLTISSATNAAPVVFTSTDHKLSTGQTVTISGATGSWTPVNGSFGVTVVDADTFSIAVDSTNFGALSGTLSVQVYPSMCAATMDFPRFALSDGQRLFIADGGNDRVLVYNSVPTSNGQVADAILGQPSDLLNLASDSAYEWRRSSADSLRTPLALAWDGTNLYVSDPFNRRVMVFTPAEPSIPYTGVRNSASRAIYAIGSVSFAGELKEDDEVTIKIGEKEYKYKLTTEDSVDSLVTNFANLINEGEGDPLVFAMPNLPLAVLILVARAEGSAGDEITLSATTPAEAAIIATPSGATLRGGGDAAKLAPGTIIQIVGANLSEGMVSAPPDANPLPTELGGVQVYFDGIRSPLLFVSPTQINAQLPFDVSDSTGVNAYVRTRWSDGRVTVTNPVAVPIIPQNPGIFAVEGADPRQAVALHYSSHATGTVSIDGTAVAGDVVSILIQDRTYTYTVQEGDTLNSIRDAFIRLISADPLVEAFASSIWTRVRLRARIPGPEANGLRISVSSPEGSSAILTPFNEFLCCANEAGSLITEDNPALPGETIVVYATGLGLITPSEAQSLVRMGVKYEGPELNEPLEFVSSLAGGKTANVLATGLKPGMIGIYEVHLELNSGQTTDPLTQVTIAQSQYVSNVVTIPVFNPAGP
jgi:uncharacterized protein (TIGR03437 family)